MKTSLLMATVLIIGFHGLAKEARNPLMDSDTVVWTGLDYSMVRMIGGNNFKYGFQAVDLIFPGMPEKWNQLFLDERIEVAANALGKRVSIDTSGVAARNKTATTNQIILTPGPKDVIKESHLTKQDIASAIRSYKMDKANGLGLVFIVDRLVHRHHTPASDAHGTSSLATHTSGGAVYVVFFDIATRDVISANRETASISTGANFRNFWFGPIKDADKSLKQYKTPAPSSTTPKRFR